MSILDFQGPKLLLAQQVLSHMRLYTERHTSLQPTAREGESHRDMDTEREASKKVLRERGREKERERERISASS